MAPADGIAKVALVGRKARRVLRLDEGHALPVEPLDELVDLALGAVKAASRAHAKKKWERSGRLLGALGALLGRFQFFFDALWRPLGPSRYRPAPLRRRSRTALRGTRGFQKRCGDAFDDNPSKNTNYTFGPRKTYDFEVPGCSRRGRTGHL